MRHSARPSSWATSRRCDHDVHNLAGDSMGSMRHDRLRSGTVVTLSRQRRQRRNDQEPAPRRHRPRLQPMEGAADVPLPQRDAGRFRCPASQLVEILPAREPQAHSGVAVRPRLTADVRIVLSRSSSGFPRGYYHRGTVLRQDGPQMDRQTRRAPSTARPLAKRVCQLIPRPPSLVADLRLVSRSESRRPAAGNRFLFHHSWRGTRGVRRPDSGPRSTRMEEVRWHSTAT